MRPVTVAVTVPNGRQEVYDFLEVLANHEPFTDHMLVDWHYSGPSYGLGARARMRLKKRGRPDWMDLEVVEVHRPSSTVEETVGAGGRRRTRGTYVLEEAPAAGPGSPSASSGSARRWSSGWPPPSRARCSGAGTSGRWSAWRSG